MRKVEAVPQSRFDEICETNHWTDDNVETLTDTAFISIIGTEDVLKYYLHEDETEHWFKNNHNNVLNLEFDDVDKDIEFHGHKAYAMTDEQAQQVVDFIEKNIGKKILIHCRAGQSRSCAIAVFVLNNYSDIYKWSECVSDEHNYNHPNVDVLAKLNRVLWKKHFEN